jgi:hypothetical protein
VNTLEPIQASRIRGPRLHLRLPIDTYSDGIDWIAVERAALGELHPAELTPDETREAALLMDAAGFTDQEISIRLCVFARQIHRWKNPTPAEPRPVRLCTEPGCDRKHKRRGYCEKCIQRVARRERAAARQQQKEAA